MTAKFYRSNVAISIMACCYKDAMGKYHPAVQALGNIMWYWPNLTFDNYVDAEYHAQQTILTLVDHTLDYMNQWNVWGIAVEDDDNA